MLAGELHFGSASSSSAIVSPIDIPRDSFDLDDATLDEFADVIEPDSECLSLVLEGAAFRNSGCSRRIDFQNRRC